MCDLIANFTQQKSIIQMVQYIKSNFMTAFYPLYEEMVEHAFLIGKLLRPVVKEEDQHLKSGHSTSRSQIQEDCGLQKKNVFNKNERNKPHKIMKFNQLNDLYNLTHQTKIETDKILRKLPFWEKHNQKEFQKVYPKQFLIKSKKENKIKIGIKGVLNNKKKCLDRSIMTFEENKNKLQRAKTNLETQISDQKIKLSKMSTSELNKNNTPLTIKNFPPKFFINGIYIY